MNNFRLTAAESHELATRVSALGAKQVLLILRQLQDQSLALSINNGGCFNERALRTQTETGATNKGDYAIYNNHAWPH
ncbi:hypothetical protein QTO01_15015 [Vibrio mytili]|uniref:hypothetical protein n=1 Tax=Vibrio mytili TaxID=50718 RepID=UPI002F422487